MTVSDALLAALVHFGSALLFHWTFFQGKSLTGKRLTGLMQSS